VTKTWSCVNDCSRPCQLLTPTQQRFLGAVTTTMWIVVASASDPAQFPGATCPGTKWRTSNGLMVPGYESISAAQLTHNAMHHHLLSANMVAFSCSAMLVPGFVGNQTGWPWQRGGRKLQASSPFRWQVTRLQSSHLCWCLFCTVGNYYGQRLNTAPETQDVLEGVWAFE
jgi:hypothetical protein